MTPPCYGCKPPERTSTCHTTCEKYKEFRIALDKENAERKKKIEAHIIQNDIEKDRIRRASEGKFYRSRSKR